MNQRESRKKFVFTVEAVTNIGIEIWNKSIAYIVH